MTDSMQGSGTTIYRNGSVYSPADPFATALLVQNGVVLWVGQEAGADSLTGDDVDTVDLNGLLVAPGFVARVDAAPEPAASDQLVRSGYTAVVHSDAGEIRFRALGAENREHGLVADAVVVPSGRAKDMAEDGGTKGLLIDVEDPADGPWIDLARRSLAAGRATGLITTVQAAAPSNPWLTTETALRSRREDQGLSTRGCFGLQTRGARRLFAAGGPMGGQIVPDAPADFVGWEADALMVQTSDDRVAAWSTDPRARTPLLPELGAGEPPSARLAVVGTRAYRW